jgi:hypothetical protein
MLAVHRLFAIRSAMCWRGANNCRRQAVLLGSGLPRNNHWSRGCSIAVPTGSSAVGSAPALGAGGREFKSPLPDQEIPGQMGVRRVRGGGRDAERANYVPLAKVGLARANPPSPFRERA